MIRLTIEDQSFIRRAMTKRASELEKLAAGAKTEEARASFSRGAARHRDLAQLIGADDLVMGSGVAMIAEERQRVVSAEGYSPEHDAEHTHGELARAAACHAAPSPIVDADTHLPVWPDGWQRKPHDRIRDLVIAGQFCAAEIDRLQAEASA